MTRRGYPFFLFHFREGTMKKRLLAGLAAISALFIIAGSAAAQEVSPSRAGAISVSPHLGWFWAEGSEPYDPHSLNLGIGIGYSLNEVLGFEFSYDNMEPDLKGRHGRGDKDEDINMFRFDGLYHWRQGKQLQPYVGLGLGFGDYEHQEVRFLVDAGGGVEYFLMNQLALRADSRYIYTVNHSVSNLLTTFGVTYYIGGNAGAKQAAEAAPAPLPPAPEAAAPPEEAPAPEAKGETCIELKVNFDFDKADIKPEFDSELKRVADFMQANPDSHATIEAYADAVGTTEYNLKLTDRRAQAVKDYLVKNYNISADRLDIQGMGKSNPIASNLTDAGRAQNRRAVRVFCSNGKEMTPPKPKEVCIGMKVMFDTGSAEIKPEYEPEIKRVADYMKEHPDMNGTVEGYTDNTGPDKLNKKLSEDRALAVKDKLVKDYGISADRLKTEGFGESRPINDNSTPEGRAENRYAVEMICTPAGE
jgi:OOP family OmpA-OmpF porin